MLAVNVADADPQIVVLGVEIEMVGVTDVVTVIVIALLVAVVVDKQLALLVNTQVTMFPFAKVVVV
jgi:tRNA G46 methylase TrmB